MCFLPSGGYRAYFTTLQCNQQERKALLFSTQQPLLPHSPATHTQHGLHRGTHTRTYAHMLIYTHTDTHTYTHTDCMHAHIHTHTQTHRVFSGSSELYILLFMCRVWCSGLCQS